MKMFGDGEFPSMWRDRIDGKVHVLVAVSRGGWQDLCRARPSSYETVEPDPNPTDEPVVWKHDRSDITCGDCIAVIDGAVLEWIEVPT